MAKQESSALRAVKGRTPSPRVQGLLAHATCQGHDPRLLRSKKLQRTHAAGWRRQRSRSSCIGRFGMRHACVVLAEPQERRVAGAPELKGCFWHSRSNRRRASSSETLSSGGGRLSQEFLPHGLSVARRRRRGRGCVIKGRSTTACIRRLSTGRRGRMYSIGSRHRRSLGEHPCPTIIPSSRASSSTIAETGWARAMLPRPDAVGDTTCRAPRYRDASKRLGRSRASRLQRSKTAFRARSGSIWRVTQARSRTIISIATSAAAMSRARSANAHQQTRHLGRIFETPSTGSRSVRPGSRSSSASASSAKGRIDY